MLLTDQTDATFLRRVRGLIFDCDGVLIDSYAANTAYYNQFRKRFGLPPMNREEADATHILNVFESLRRIIPEEHYEAAVAYRLELDYREILPHLKREPGIRRLVRRLKDLGLPLAVNTNRMDTMPMVLSTVDLEGVFHPVMTSATVTRPKPDPEGVEKILAAWGMQPGEVAFLGDSSVDEATAKNAGVPFWAFKNPALEAELHVPDFPTLQRAFERAWPERGEASGEHS